MIKINLNNLLSKWQLEKYPIEEVQQDHIDAWKAFISLKDIGLITDSDFNKLDDLESYIVNITMSVRTNN